MRARGKASEPLPRLVFGLRRRLDFGLRRGWRRSLSGWLDSRLRFGPFTLEFRLLHAPIELYALGFVPLCHPLELVRELAQGIFLLPDGTLLFMQTVPVLRENDFLFRQC